MQGSGSPGEALTQSGKPAGSPGEWREGEAQGLGRGTS